ncbi:hypothetical protein EsDP_00002491 [Epichloe bromicola]|uniref:HAUS augmin-like complex subunit 6 N-terminal domain-containing protein n=1 Tax=Epichloe bromicola TaxID=79588 RepID=A0ABQ0CKZ6_9HYPO
MATVQPRTRPRVNTAATNSRPKSTSTAATPYHDNGGASNASAPPLSVFLTNLRLLDLDLLPDWPGITFETFATTGVQGQKRRIQCVEWVLVKLFALWDPEETSSVSNANLPSRTHGHEHVHGRKSGTQSRVGADSRQKLDPFFPPHDQMQSVNLRGALLRALDTVKKNGLLGRDSVIRKTMLDDCKGERLEEVLAYFSTAVLKRVIEENMNATREHPPIAVNLALENRGYDSDNAELHALNLSYRASLRRFLEQKEETRVMCRDFGDLLSIKERGIVRRMEAVRAREADSGRDRLSDNAREEVRRLVRNNWSGNEKWMETLVKGDANSQGTGLLGMPFDRVWRRVQQGRLAELEENSGGLLEQLDIRVGLQKDRLAKWNTFQKSAFGRHLPDASASPSKKRETGEKPNRGIDFQFSVHPGLQVGATSKSLGASQARKSKPSQGYEDLLTGLKDELARIKSVDSTVLDFLGRTEFRRRCLEEPLGGQSTEGGEAVSDVSELEDEPCEPATAPIPVRTNRTKLDSLRRHPVKPRMPTSEVFSQSTSTQSSLSPPCDQEPRLRKQDFSLLPPTNDFEELEPPPSPTQNMADDILEAVNQASPSPVKRPRQRPTLSLAQRTRLSMAGNRFPFLDEEPDLPLGPLVSRDEAGPTPPSEPDTMKEDCGAMDLVSRTRLSMAGFEQAQRKARQERRKSLRRSKVLPTRKEGDHFPRVQGQDGHDGEALTQELIMEEDMEAVFKSRPKMRTSPVGSPVREW